MTEQLTSAGDVKPDIDQSAEAGGSETIQSADLKQDQAQTASETAQDPAASKQDPVPGDDKPEKPRTRRDTRIEQLLAEKHAVIGFAERERAARLEAERKAGTQLRPEDYQSDAAYLQAVAEQAVAKARMEISAQQIREAEGRAAAAGEAAWRERTADIRMRLPDFDQVAHNPNLMVTPVMADAIRESDLGGEIAYYLGKNPNEAARIASLAPVSQATAIARLESRVSKASSYQTKAPAPADQVLKGKSGGGQKSLEDMSFEEYRKARGF